MILTESEKEPRIELNSIDTIVLNLIKLALGPIVIFHPPWISEVKIIEYEPEFFNKQHVIDVLSCPVTNRSPNSYTLIPKCYFNELRERYKKYII